MMINRYVQNSVLTLNRLGPILTAVCVLLVSAGCAITPQLSVNVDAIDSGQSVQDVRYVLKPAVDGVDKSDLHFIEYSRHIDKALQQRGMQKAGSVAQANVEIAVDYGYERVEQAVFRSSGYYDPFFFHRGCGRFNRAGCSDRFSSRNFDRFGPSYGRHRQHVDVIPNYLVFIALEARHIDRHTNIAPGQAAGQSANPSVEQAAEQSAEQSAALWATRARAHFAKPDLRITLPLLLIAAEEYLSLIHI